jgi:hypothetical protein
VEVVIIEGVVVMHGENSVEYAGGSDGSLLIVKGDDDAEGL